MSAIRDKARSIIDAALPGNTIVTSNGATAAKYTELTGGLTHKTLTDNWAAGGIMTGCNAFTGWYGGRMGSKVYLGGFDLKGIVQKAGREEAWVTSTASNRPNYGDILRHASFHVDVALDFDGDVLLRAAGGQGGKGMGCDVVRRVRGGSAYDWHKLQGWIDIEVFFGTPAAPNPEMAWLYGWWTVWDGNTYYYYFSPNGRVHYVKSRPTAHTPAPTHPLNTGNYRFSGASNMVITWDPADDGTTTETFYNALRGASRMNAYSNRYSPLVATKVI